MSSKGGEEGEPILTGTPADTVGYDPIYTETYKKKETKIFVGICLTAVVFFVLISVVILAIYAGLRTPLYVLPLINILGISQTIIFVTVFVYTGKLTKSCVWAIPVFSGVIIAESICTDIFAFTIEL